jgi:hypothetical protein
MGEGKDLRPSESAKAGVASVYSAAAARAKYEGRKARRAAEKAVSKAAAASRRLAEAAARAAGKKRKKGGGASAESGLSKGGRRLMGARRHTFKSSRWRGAWNWRGAAAPGAAGGHRKKAKKKAPSAAEKAAAAAEMAAELEGSIEQMSARGLTPQQISLLTGIDPERLYCRHKAAMMRGGARRTDEVVVGGPERAWRLVEAGQARFLRERLRSGRGGGEADGVALRDLRRLSLEQLRALERALRPLAGLPGEIEPKRARGGRPRGGERATATGTVTEG